MFTYVSLAEFSMEIFNDHVPRVLNVTASTSQWTPTSMTLLIPLKKIEYAMGKRELDCFPSSSASQQKFYVAIEGVLTISPNSYAAIIETKYTICCYNIALSSTGRLEATIM